MKRLLEWKQRMLQSPLTRKGAAGGGAARSGSERSTPTMPQLAGGANGSSPGEDMSSPRLPSRIPPNQSSLDQSMAVPTGKFPFRNGLVVFACASACFVPLHLTHQPPNLLRIPADATNP